MTAARHPALARLDALLGDWDVTVMIEGNPMEGGCTRFEWVEDGVFLRQRADAEIPESAPREWRENAPFPVTSMIGLDDAAEQFTILYSDARNVYRVYEMTLDDGVWKQWRHAPGFHQRFTGRFRDDGNTIDAAWEFSEDGETWRLDFELSFRRAHRD
jgi:hypothetical protein